MDMIDHAEKARSLFYEGYNCAQAVLCAFTDVTGMDMKLSAKMASSFGGGLGRQREVCGTVSAACLVLGIVMGYSDPKDPEAKKNHYALVRRFCDSFRGCEGSIICRELLTKAQVEERSITPGADPEARTAEYYKKRPCPQLAWQAAHILEDMLRSCPNI